MKNTRFQEHFSFKHLGPLPFQRGCVIMLWNIRNAIFYMFDVYSKLVSKTSHALHNMTNYIACHGVLLVLLACFQTQICFSNFYEISEAPFARFFIQIIEIT